MRCLCFLIMLQTAQGHFTALSNGVRVTEQQVSSHMSMLARRWNQWVLRVTETLREQVGAHAGDALQGEVDEGVEVGEVMQRVQEAARRRSS